MNYLLFLISDNVTCVLYEGWGKQHNIFKFSQTYVILISFVGLIGAGMVSFTLSRSMEILALIPLSWKMLVCISNPEFIYSGMWEPTTVTNSTPAEGMKAISLCKKW